MKLKTYLEKHGDAELAALIGVKERTTASWRRGERIPSHKAALLIVGRTGGLVSYAECYGLEASQ